ncbi:SPOR domain-containing protein [Leptospira fluminis]|uniref:SPOR domain-containing protein n=1 Tax=Leptospira fluminis TaxID=2484979 RepID=A0A4R9GN79_9LEPT|nr:SPOR domain-containing protein [Leptospira fluminis]TGK15599.1 SPOR domain-containing protein [Leptospira fluminis]
MKEKVFYVINLDNKRIALLSMFLIALLFSFFFLGVSIGRKKGHVQEDLSLNQGLEPSSSAVPTSVQPTPVASNSITSGNPPKEEEIKFRNLPPGTEVVDLRAETASKKEDPAKLAPEAPSEPHKEKKIVKREKDSKKGGASSVAHKSPRKHEAGFYVQVAAFKGKEKADELKSSLGGKSYVKKTKNGYYTVRMGNFSSREEADGSMKKLPSNLRGNALITKE